MADTIESMAEASEKRYLERLKDSGKSPQQAYAEREKRIYDAIQLKVPDRVPVFFNMYLFAAKYTGMSMKEAFYNSERWAAANKKTVLDFEPDLAFPIGIPTSGQALEAAGFNQYRWPGHGAPDNSGHQFVEGEYLKADEYDAFLRDPTDFAVRTIAPRVFGALSPLAKLPSLEAFMQGFNGVNVVNAALGDPEVLAAIESLCKSAREAAKFNAATRRYNSEMKDLGFPTFTGGNAQAPFDVVSDYMRGMKGSMIDMYRQPDKLLATCEKIYPYILNQAISGTKRTGVPRVYIPLHRGADGFMSDRQFQTFYWPGLKRIVCDLIDNGLTPVVHWEGVWNERLDYLAELPKGKVFGYFNATDLAKAKKALANNMCIVGGVPNTLLQVGTPGQVRSYTKELIETVGKDGGFIICSRGPMDTVEPELVRVFFDSVREYGVYR